MHFLVVGCGSSGQRHIKTLTSIGGHSMSAFDTSQARISACLKKFPGVIPIVGKNFRDAWNAWQGKNRAGIPGQERAAVVIATPPESHLSLTEQVVEAGLHCLIEKPISAIGSDIQDVAYRVGRLHSLSATKRLVLMTAYQYRYSKAFKEIYDSVKVSDEIYSIMSYYGYIGAAHASENIFSRVTAHQINYVRALLRHIGSPVGSELKDSEPEILYNKNDASMILDGRLCPAFISSNTVSKDRRHHVIIETSGGKLEWNDDGSEAEQMNTSMMQHFLSCIELGTQPETGVIDALHDVKLLKVKRYKEPRYEEE